MGPRAAGRSWIAPRKLRAGRYLRYGSHTEAHGAHLRKRWGTTIAPLHLSHATLASRTGWALWP